MLRKIVLSKEEADKVAVVYSPRRFPTAIQPAAREFVSLQAMRPDGMEPSFRIDKIVAQQTGIADLERLSIEEKVEREALLRVKDLQEQAYQEAYQLGFDEGRETAFVERKAELVRSLNQLSSLIASIERLKSDLVASNETQIIRLVFEMAKRIALHEISVRPDAVLEVMRQAVASAQTDETFTIRVSPDDFQFIESVKEKLGKDFEFLQKSKLEASEEITHGGCVIETNYGAVNATVEQRLSKLWETLSEKLPKIQDVLKAESTSDAIADDLPVIPVVEDEESDDNGENEER